MIANCTSNVRNNANLSDKQVVKWKAIVDINQIIIYYEISVEICSSIDKNETITLMRQAVWIHHDFKIECEIPYNYVFFVAKEDCEMCKSIL